MKVAAFFYGNGVPLLISTHFFSMCSPHWDDLAAIEIFNLYRMWHTEWNKPHQATYYDTMYKKMYWLNGQNYSSHEPVIPEQTDITLGYDSSGHGDVIVGRLNPMTYEESRLVLFP